MSAKLISISSSGEREEYLIKERITTIGRRSSNDIPVDEKSVSGRHAQIISTPQGVILKDLGSTNGTYVNGEQITRRAALRDGDKINLGAFRLIFHSEAEEDEDDSEQPTLRGILEDSFSGELERVPSAYMNQVRAQQIEVRQYISILTRQWSFVLVFTLSAILTAIAITYVVSEKYEARTTIFYRPIEVIRLKPQEATAFGSPVPTTAFSVIGKTIEELLQSQLILGRVVDTLNLDEDEEDKDYSGEPWYIYYYKTAKDLIKEYGTIAMTYLKYGRNIENETRVNAIAALSKNVKVEIDEAYISYIIVRDKNNQRAAEIANRLGEELISWLKEKERAPLQFRKQRLRKALDDIQAEVDQHRSALLKLLDDNKVSSIKYELEQGNIRLSSLEAARIEMLTSISNYATQIEDIEDKLNLNTSQGGQGGDNQSLNSRSRRLSSDDFKRLNSEQLSLSIALEGERSKLKSMEAEITRLDKRLRNLSMLDIEYQRIDGLLTKANRDHLQIKDALQEVIVREYSIDSEIGILHQATVPKEPVSPIKYYHAGLAGLLGLVVSVGLVYLLTFFNIRILFASRGVVGRRNTPASSGS